MPTPFETANGLAARVAVAETAATQAEAQRAAVCAAEQAGTQAAAAMDNQATARDYMRLSTIASNAFRIRSDLDAALQLALAAHARTLDAQAAAAATTAQATAIAASHALTMGEQQALDLNGVHHNAADQATADAAHARAKADSDRAHQLGSNAEASLAAAGPIKTAATNAREAGLKIQSATRHAGRLGQAGGALPPAPNPATAAQYNLEIAALQAAALAALPADTATAAAAGAQLSAAAGPADAALTAQQLVVTTAVQRATDRESRQIYRAGAVRTEQQNHFDTDVSALGKLSTDADAGARTIDGAVTAAVAPLAQVDAAALALPGALAALRGHADAVYTAAHAAAGLMPYDPAINCGHALAALTHLEQAESAMRELLVQEQASKRESQRAREAVAAAETAAAVLRSATRRAREAGLEAAWEKARAATRSGDAKSVFQKAKENLTTADVAMADCPLRGARHVKVRAALEALIHARAQLANAGNTPDIEAADASVAQGRTAAGAIAAARTRTAAALAAAKLCLDGARAAWAHAVAARIAQQREEGHGPQRHEGDPTVEDLGRRALYGIDPETKTQCDAESGELHSADLNASKFKNEETYVRAELLARAAPPGATVRLSPLGPGAAVGVSCPRRPGAYRTVMLAPAPPAPPAPATPAQALRVPVSAAYLDNGTQPPPTAAQMDAAAITAELNALTHATVFGRDAQIKAILRTDTHNKVFLRTMWPQNPDP